MNYIKGSAPYSNVTASEIGILVIHGFTGTTSSLSSLNEAFTKAGYNVECPRLSGHGSDWIELEKTKYENWLDDVEKALEKLKKRSKKIFVAGLSMGGTLALYLAENHPELFGIMLINNALIMRDIRFFLLPVLKNFLRTSPGIGSDIKDSSETEICYDTVPTKAVYEMLKLFKHVKKEIRLVKIPALIFKSEKDHVVPKVSALYTYKRISSQIKELVWLTDSYHVATMDHDKGLICGKCLDFINNHI